MKKIFKSTLYRLLGLKNYLRLLYRALAFAMDTGLLKKNEAYLLHQFTQKIISKGDVVVDVGANLGYYTRLFLKAVGENGVVYAVEPVKPFYENISHFLGKHQNLVLYNYALGTEDKDIQLSVPDQYGYLRTGLPSVHDENTSVNTEKLLLFPAEMKRGSELFSTIEHVDYLKMDIEGYERFVIPELKSFIERTLPCIQVELNDISRPIIEATLFDLGYEAYYYTKDTLTKSPIQNYNQDQFYIHPSKVEKYKIVIV